MLFVDEEGKPEPIPRTYRKYSYVIMHLFPETGVSSAEGSVVGF